jgi:hypothetical protein
MSLGLAAEGAIAPVQFLILLLTRWSAGLGFASGERRSPPCQSATQGESDPGQNHYCTTRPAGGHLSTLPLASMSCPVSRRSTVPGSGPSRNGKHP